MKGPANLRRINIDVTRGLSPRGEKWACAFSRWATGTPYPQLAIARTAGSNCSCEVGGFTLVECLHRIASIVAREACRRVVPIVEHAIKLADSRTTIDPAQHHFVVLGEIAVAVSSAAINQATAIHQCRMRDWKVDEANRAAAGPVMTRTLFTGELVLRQLLKYGIEPAAGE